MLSQGTEQGSRCNVSADPQATSFESNDGGSRGSRSQDLDHKGKRALGTAVWGVSLMFGNETFKFKESKRPLRASYKSKTEPTKQTQDPPLRLSYAKPLPVVVAVLGTWCRAVEIPVGMFWPRLVRVELKVSGVKGMWHYGITWGFL